MESDPFFLDWGSSVNVNEDLRRTIRTEINTLDQDLQKLDQSIRTEEKTSSLLHRDFSHAQAELISLKNEVSEEKENAAMNEQFQMKLGESLEKEVVNVISVQREQTGPGESGCESGCESAVELGMAEYVMKRSQEIKHLKMTIQAKKTSLNERLIKVDEVQIQLKDANDRIMKEERNQSVWNDDVEIQQKEFSAESQRMQSVKDSLTKRRKNVGDFTQQRTECKRSLDSTKESNKGEEARWNSELEDANTTIVQFTEQAKTIVKSKLQTSSRTEMLHRQFDERDDIAAESQRVKNDFVQVDEKLESHRSREEELLQLIAHAKLDVEAKQQDINLVKEEMAKVDEIRASNDKEEAAVLDPAKKEHPCLLAHGENVSKQILVLENRSASTEKSTESDILASKASLEEIKKQVAEKLARNEEKKDLLKAISQSREEIAKNATEEIAQHDTLKRQFEESREVQEAEIVQKEEDLDKLRGERLEAKKLERICEEISLEKLSCGVQNIQDADRMVKEFEAKAASLQAAA